MDEQKMDDQKMDEFKEAAQNFVRQLVAGDFAGACRRFDGELAAALPEARLKESWLQLIDGIGPFQEILKRQAVVREERCIVTLTCQFEKLPIDMRIVFGPSGQIGGLR